MDTKRTDALSYLQSDRYLATDSTVLHQEVVAGAVRDDDEQSQYSSEVLYGFRNGIFLSLPFWLILFITLRYLL